MLPKLMTRVRFPSPAPVSRTRPILAAAGALLAASAAPAAADAYPFEGRWDCEVGIFTFTATSYAPGGEVMEILDVARQDGGYVLSFADGYQIGLSPNPDGTMEWLSFETGDGFTCRPLP